MRGEVILVLSGFWLLELAGLVDQVVFCELAVGSSWVAFDYRFRVATVPTAMAARLYCSAVEASCCRHSSGKNELVLEDRCPY